MTVGRPRRFVKRYPGRTCASCRSRPWRATRSKRSTACAASLLRSAPLWSIKCGACCGRARDCPRAGYYEAEDATAHDRGRPEEPVDPLEQGSDARVVRPAGSARRADCSGGPHGAACLCREDAGSEARLRGRPRAGDRNRPGCRSRPANAPPRRTGSPNPSRSPRPASTGKWRNSPRALLAMTL